MPNILIFTGATFGNVSNALKQATREAIAFSKKNRPPEPVVTALNQLIHRQSIEEVSIVEVEITENTTFRIADQSLVLEEVVSEQNQHVGLNSALFSSPVNRVVLSLSDICLVIKRTLGDASNIFIEIAKLIEPRGVKILNGAEFIERSRSKIEQFIKSDDKTIFPATVCINCTFFEEDSFTLDEKIDKIFNHLSNISFPLVLKPTIGSRAKGIVLFHNWEVLRAYLYEHLAYLLMYDGFILQKVINTDRDLKKSVYYRINLVAGKPQSAVKFEYVWTRSDVGLIELRSPKVASNFPVCIDDFDPVKLSRVLAGCGLPSDATIGVDILLDVDTKEMYFLESNTTPTVVTLVKLGQNALNSSDSLSLKEITAAQACVNFPSDIAEYCISIVKTCQVVSMVSLC